MNDYDEVVELLLKLRERDKIICKMENEIEKLKEAQKDEFTWKEIACGYNLSISAACKEIAELKERIKELEEGSCRMPFC